MNLDSYLLQGNIFYCVLCLDVWLSVPHCSLPPSPVKLRFPGKTSMSARPVSSNPTAVAAVGSARPATAMKLLSMLVRHFCYNPALMSQSFSLCMFCMLVRRTCARPGFPCRLRPGLPGPSIRKKYDKPKR